jgi:hypothetical protein
MLVREGQHFVTLGGTQSLVTLRVSMRGSPRDWQAPLHAGWEWRGRLGKEEPCVGF